MIAMLPLFKKDEQKEQYEELNKRILMCRKMQGMEINYCLAI